MIRWLLGPWLRKEIAELQAATKKADEQFVNALALEMKARRKYEALTEALEHSIETHKAEVEAWEQHKSEMILKEMSKVFGRKIILEEKV